MPSFRLRLPSSLFAAVLLAISGCAAQRAFNEGQALAGRGELPAAEAKLREASELEPRNVEFRTALLRTREMRDLLARAQQAEQQAKARQETQAALARENAAKPEGKAPLERQLGLAYRKPINLELDEGTLKQAFTLIARASGLNFVYDREVRLDQKLSIQLKNSTVEAALFYTLMTNQLEHQVLDANTILIYPNSPTKIRDYQEMEVRTFHLSHADAKNVANYLRTFVKSKDIGFDEKLNLVTIRDNAEAIAVAEKLVTLQDVPEPEVMLEVEVLEVNRSRLQQLGLIWPDSLALTPIAPPGGLTLRDVLHNLNPGTIGAALSAAAVKAKRQDSDATILANPRIRVRNREKAKIMVGERLPNITTTANATGFIAETINYVDVGLKLDVEPTIALNDDVAIRVGLEVSSIVGQLQSKAGTTAYQLGTRNATTLLSLRDGETQILAGLINDSDRSDATKVPALGDIPLLGRLFGATTDNGQKTEVVLSITPHLIRNIQRPEPALTRFRSGTESNFRVRPASVMAATEAAPASAAISGPTELPAPLPVRLVNDGSTSAEWQGPTSVRSGTEFVVQLDTSMRGPLDSLPLKLQYDTKALKLIGVREGNFLNQGGATTTFHTQANASGLINFNMSRAAAVAIDVPGTLLQLRFQAVAPSDSAKIVVVSMQPSSTNGTSIVTPPAASITVKVE